MEQVKTKKRGIIIAGISAIVLIAVLGISFAYWAYSRTTDNQILVAGDIFMKYTETNQLVIKNAIPSKEPGANDYFEFKITGKNTYNKPIWYEIVLNHGVENPEGRTERLLDKFLMFRLVEIKGEEEQIVVDNASYEDIKSKKIWVNTIPAGTKDNIEITYRLYMWISFDTKIGNTTGNDYDMETWNNEVYASVRVSVNGDFEEKELEKEPGKNLIETLKSKADQEGEIVAVDKEGNKCETISSCEVRDYRFSGKPVNNYVKLNNNSQEETWRIIGIFKDENGEEYTRIAGRLPEDIPEEYTIDGTTYKIKNLDGGAYYNYITGDDTVGNDWSKAGLQYYLNTEQDSKGTKGYLNHLSEETKSMLRDEKYYLGSVNTNDGTIVKEIYNQERTVNDCQGGVGPITNATSEAIETNSGCRVWANNKATWEGKVGSLYLSDLIFVYSDSLNYSVGDFMWGAGSSCSDGWIGCGITSISPSSVETLNLTSISNFRSWPEIYSKSISSSSISYIVLALKNSVVITNGSGTEADPYQLSAE